MILVVVDAILDEPVQCLKSSKVLCRQSCKSQSSRPAWNSGRTSAVVIVFRSIVVDTRSTSCCVSSIGGWRYAAAIIVADVKDSCNRFWHECCARSFLDCCVCFQIDPTIAAWKIYAGCFRCRSFYLIGRNLSEQFDGLVHFTLLMILCVLQHDTTAAAWLFEHDASSFDRTTLLDSSHFDCMQRQSLELLLYALRDRLIFWKSLRFRFHANNYYWHFETSAAISQLYFGQRRMDAETKIGSI